MTSYIVALRSEQQLDLSAASIVMRQIALLRLKVEGNNLKRGVRVFATSQAIGDLRERIEKYAHIEKDDDMELL